MRLHYVTPYHCSQETLKKIKILSVDKLFSNAIRNVSEFGSISSLFNISDSYQTELI